MLEAIKSLAQTTDMVRKLTIYISRRLAHVDSLSNITMKEGIFDIKMMKGPITGDKNAKNGADGGKFDNRNMSSK